MQHKRRYDHVELGGGGAAMERSPAAPGGALQCSLVGCRAAVQRSVLQRSSPAFSVQHKAVSRPRGARRLRCCNGALTAASRCCVAAGVCRSCSACCSNGSRRPALSKLKCSARCSNGALAGGSHCDVAALVGELEAAVQQLGAPMELSRGSPGAPMEPPRQLLELRCSG